MTRSRGASTFFIVVSLIMILDVSQSTYCQAFFDDADDILSLSDENERSTMLNSINNCVEPDSSCNQGSRSCCNGSTCRCNLWGYNCKCKFNDEMPVSVDTHQSSMRNPSDKRNPTKYYEKRSCIRRGGACDHRPNECCHSSSCRCNLWGSNCRCQRVGLFQKWG